MKVWPVPCEAGEWSCFLAGAPLRKMATRFSHCTHFSELTLLLLPVMKLLSCNSQRFSLPTLLLIIIMLRREPYLILILHALHLFIELTETPQNYLLTCCVWYQSHCAVVNTDPHCAIRVVVFQREIKLRSCFSVASGAFNILNTVL